MKARVLITGKVDVRRVQRELYSVVAVLLDSMILPSECNKSAANFLFVLQSKLCTTVPLGNGKVTVIYKVTAIHLQKR